VAGIDRVNEENQPNLADEVEVDDSGLLKTLEMSPPDLAQWIQPDGGFDLASGYNRWHGRRPASGSPLLRSDPDRRRWRLPRWTSRFLRDSQYVRRFYEYVATGNSHPRAMKVNHEFFRDLGRRGRFAQMA
jgi:hypothetical protein